METKFREYPHEEALRLKREAAPDLYEALSNLMENPLFQTAVGGNPNAVERMLDHARSALAKARGEQRS